MRIYPRLREPYQNKHWVEFVNKNVRSTIRKGALEGHHARNVGPQIRIVTLRKLQTRVYYRKFLGLIRIAKIGAKIS